MCDLYKLRVSTTCVGCSKSDRLCFSLAVPLPLPAHLVVFTRGAWGAYSAGSFVSVEMRVPGAVKAQPLGTLSAENRSLVWEGEWTDEFLLWQLRVCCVSILATNVESMKGIHRQRKRSHQSTEDGPDTPPGSLHLAKQSRICRKLHQAGSPASSTPGEPFRSTGASPALPSARWGHSLCLIDPQTVILIGGQGHRMTFCKDPIWKLHIENNSWLPAETVATGKTPECRIGHTATFDSEMRRIYVFGGSKNGKWFSDMHILDMATWKWQLVEAKGKVPPLAYHSSTLFRHELFVFGGVFPLPNPQPDGCSNQLYIFNPQHSIWYQPIVVGDLPCPRSGHSMILLKNKLVIFGGWDAPMCFSDLHVLDLGFMEYAPVQVQGAVPSPRCWHASAPVSDNRMIIHGGYNGQRALTDTHIFNVDTSEWTQLTSDPFGSVPRAGHSILALASLDGGAEAKREGATGGHEVLSTLLVFGGGDNEGGFYNDVSLVPLRAILE
uniref:Zgc:163014 n=1 Tax=Petromyzon marinus TaxID=7757 RepID=S4RL26_PETMA